MTDREVINYIPILICGLEYNPVLGPQTGGIKYCNTSTLEFTNHTEKEIISMGFDFFRKFIHPDDLHKTTQTISILLNSELNNYSEIYRVKSPNHNKYIFMKAFCSIIRPSLQNQNVHFVLSTTEASIEELHSYYKQSEF